MRLSNTKRYAMAAAGMGILLFHLWIPVTPYGSVAGDVERFLVAVGYVGVDIFFFVSAYSLSLRPVTDYRSFWADRLWKLLPLFLIAWGLGKFLWFVPALLVLYAVFPPLYQVCRKRPGWAVPLLLLGWAALVVLAEPWLQPQWDVGIFLFRIPIILLGAYGAALEGGISPLVRGGLGLGLLVVGVPLLYQFAYLQKLREPFADSFYLMGIPTAIGILLAVDVLFQRASCPPLAALGRVTLELYFVQLVAGSALVAFFLRLTPSKLLTNAAVFTVVIAASIGLGAGQNWLKNRSWDRRE